MNTTPAQRAIDAVTRQLAKHRRIISLTGAGVSCSCGAHHPNLEAWEHHQAMVATEAAQTELDQP